MSAAVPLHPDAASKRGDLDLVQRFQSLDALLAEHDYFWKPRPFEAAHPGWRHLHPELYKAIKSLSDAEVDTCSAEPARFREIAQPFLPWLLELSQASELAAASGRPLTFSPFDALHAPGRKWRQVTAFAAALPPLSGHVHDWCSGKGHLARAVAGANDVTLSCFELDAQLCESGQALADKQHLPIRYIRQDLLQPFDCGQEAYRGGWRLGLHACGQLHVNLLRAGVDSAADGVAIAPCCYHKLCLGEQYQPLSTAARWARLTLSLKDVSLAVQETVTASAKERALREKESQWRLGFDALQRQLRNKDEYLPTPTLPKTMLNGDFMHFCAWAAKEKQLDLPKDIDYPQFAAAGRSRYREVRRVELVRHLFRRPLEIWLALDRALFLQERGYEVTVREFCNREITPRNILLVGRLRKVSPNESGLSVC
ncbi:methyltransferase [Hahella sp. KA22]|uniref:methyltransferase n=1 Tax=Hahella sp. KA22 TaxID=1628392 RepID=UPI000FDDE3C0|nr:methyltransferase [Hahella sp. KA22]AZZ91441.1 methyltransferase [Hahella sp. KA22]QAY54810.1 methyltransferase [Hahella sp. KA22]